MELNINEVGEGNSRMYGWVQTNPTDDTGYTKYTFRTKKGTEYKVDMLQDDIVLEIAFITKDGFNLTNKNEVYPVMATVVDIIKEHIKQNPEISIISFNPIKKNNNDNSRERLYLAYIDKLLPNSKIVKSDSNEILIKLNEDNLKGGLSDNISKKDIADKFKVSIQKIGKELNMGIKVEMEHVNSRTLSKEIAMDHLVEIPDYYTRLKKMEKEAKKKWKINESTKSNIKRLFRESVEIEVTDETPDVSTYRLMYNNREVGVIGISNATDMDMTIELVFVQLRADHQYKSMEIISDTILAIWDVFKSTERIILTPQPKSRTFWHKMGANRLNNDYLMISRGH
jgi:hypothetical protein